MLLQASNISLSNHLQNNFMGWVWHGFQNQARALSCMNGSEAHGFLTQGSYFDAYHVSMVPLMSSWHMHVSSLIWS